MKTLAQARREYAKVIKNDGGNCPCCSRWGKIHGYQVTSTHTRGMIWMFKRFRKNEWIDLGRAPRWILRAKTMSVLQHWKLLERKAKDVDEDKRGSGFWRLTEKGRDFIRNRTSISKYAFVFDNRVIKLSPQRVDVITTLGKKFSYNELMSTRMVGHP